MAIVIPFGSSQPNRRIKQAKLLPTYRGHIINIGDYVARKEATKHKDIYENRLIMAHTAKDYVESSSFRTSKAIIHSEDGIQYTVTGDEHPGLEGEIEYVSTFFFSPKEVTNETAQMLTLLISLAPYELEIHNVEAIDSEILKLLEIIFQDDLVIVY